MRRYRSLFIFHHLIPRPPASVMRRGIAGNIVSKILTSTARESNLTCKSQRLLLENGLIQLSSPGIYHFLPLGCRVLEKLTHLIDRHMREIGGQKIIMPCLSPGMLWKATDRWTTQGNELMKLTDRNSIEYTLGPTHEEVVTNLVAAQGFHSYRKLPLRLYQVGRKFRDEMKPRHGLLRAREFFMKDMYTFDVDEHSAMNTYHVVCDAYERLFNKLGLTYLKVLGSSGNIGGTLSHEFHLPAEIGEDTVFYCNSCKSGVNKEQAEGGQGAVCPECRGSREEYQGVEVAHTFFLGTKYSKVFMASFRNNNEKTELMQMGCYGVGVSRLLAASVEALSSSEDQCLSWPPLIAPYQVCILPPKEGSKECDAVPLALDLYHSLTSFPCLSNEVTVDDRLDHTIGHRATTARKLGYPYIVIAGKRALEDPALFEVEDSKLGETSFLTKEQVIEKLSKVETIPVNI